MSTLTTEQCCAIRNLSMTKQADGTITCTVTGFPDEIQPIAVKIISNYGSVYQISSWKDDPPLRTITVVSKSSSDLNHKIKQSGIFKTVPLELYNLHRNGLFHQSIIPPNYEPGSQRFIRPSTDIYGTDGWTVRDIFEELNIKVNLPSSLNYHVYQLNVQEGAPILSVLRTLFPIPGINIYAYHGRFYVSLPTTDPIPELKDMCELVGSVTDTVEYEHEVVGMQGEPLFIDSQAVEKVAVGNTATYGQLPATIDVTYNLVGGVFCINERSVSQAEFTDIVVNEYFNEGSRSHDLDTESFPNFEE